MLGSSLLKKPPGGGESRGGIWERLVGRVKFCLRKTVGRNTLTEEQLTTVVVEIEHTLYNQPITLLKLMMTVRACYYVLTPGLWTPTGNYSKQKTISTAKTLTHRARY